MSAANEPGSSREMLERLAWLFASNADNFWPIEESARACMDGVSENYEGRPNEEWDTGFAWEKGQHSRAVMESAELFEQMHAQGFDPIQMAEDYVERTNEEHDTNLSIDWDWLRFAHLPDEYTKPHIGGNAHDGGVS